MPLVSIAHIALLLLTAATPFFLFFENFAVAGSIQFYAAVVMLIVAIGLRGSEARHVFRLIRVPAMLFAIPWIWMLVQLLPLGAGGLSRSVWQSAASALETPLWPSITLDPGLTFIAVCGFATMAAIAFAAAVVSVDRQRAEKLLFLLASAATVISLVLLADQIGGFIVTNTPGSNSNYALATMKTASVIGIIVFGAALIMNIERYETRRGPRSLASHLFLPIGITIAGLVICSSTLVVGDTAHATFAAACGLATIAIIYVARRLGLGPRAGLAMGAVAIFAATMIIWSRGDPTIGELSLRYVSADNGIAALDKRVVDAVGLAGSGAGTFPAVSTIYGAHSEEDTHPATFAAKLAIELGRPALWFIFGLALVLIAMFARGAFNRGRDCFYPLAGAGVTVAMVLNGFTDATLANPAVSILVALTLGLGFGQNIGRGP